LQIDLWKESVNRAEQADAARDWIRDRATEEVLGGAPVKAHLLRKARRLSFDRQFALFGVDPARAWERAFGGAD